MLQVLEVGRIFQRPVNPNHYIREMSTGLHAELHYCSNIQLTTALILMVSFYCSEVGLTPSLFCFGSPKCTLMPHCYPYKTLDIHRYVKKHEDSGKQSGFCLEHSSTLLPRIPLEQRIPEGFLFT